MLPESLFDPLKEQIEKVKRVHQKDLADGDGKTSLPQGQFESTLMPLLTLNGSMSFLQRLDAYI